MKLLLYVGLGAAVGGMSRYLLAGFIQQRAGPGFPLGTLVINVSGSFVLGFIMRYALQTGAISPEARALLTTGFCGGYTTFSTAMVETMNLIRQNRHRAAALNGVGVLVVTVLLAGLGLWAGTQLAG